MPRRPRFKSETPRAASRPLIRALADARARWARSAPRVMLRESATAINSWRSTRSKRMAISFEHDPEKWEPVFRKDHAQSKGSAFVMAEGSLNDLQIVP